MATADLTRLMNNARIKLPGALDSTIQLELFATVEEFLASTNAWIEDINFAVTPASKSYQITPTDGVINRLISVVDSGGATQHAIMSIPGTIQLQFSPSKSDTFTARVAKTVTDPVDSGGYPVFPDWILEKYGSDMLDGVLGRMMGQIAKPYSSPSIAMYHLRKFEKGVNRARAEVSHGNLYRAQNWRFPQSFASGRYRTF